MDTWFATFRDYQRYLNRLETPVNNPDPDTVPPYPGSVLDSLTQEFDAIRKIRDLLRELDFEQRKRVWFYCDDLVKDGLGE